MEISIWGVRDEKGSEVLLENRNGPKHPMETTRAFGGPLREAVWKVVSRRGSSLLTQPVRG